MKMAQIECPVCGTYYKAQVTLDCVGRDGFLRFDKHLVLCERCLLAIHRVKIRRSAKILLHDGSGRLVFHQANGKPYRLPGGSFESQETSPKDCLVRECKEEFNFELDLESMAFVDDLLQYDNSINTYWFTSLYVYLKPYTHNGHREPGHETVITGAATRRTVSQKTVVQVNLAAELCDKKGILINFKWL